MKNIFSTRGTSCRLSLKRSLLSPLLFLAALFGCLVGAQAAMAYTVTITLDSGDVKRSANPNEMDLLLTLHNLNPSDMVSGDLQKTIIQRLSIYLTSYPIYASVPLAWQGATTKTSTSTTGTATTVGNVPNFLISFTSTPTQTILADGVTFNLQIAISIVDSNNPLVLTGLMEKPSTTSTSSNTSDYIPITVSYQDYTSNVSSADFDVDVITSVANANPTNLMASSSYKAIDVSWTQDSTIQFNDNVARAPYGVNVFVIDLTAHPQLALPATTYNADITKEVAGDTTCSFSFDGLNTCTVACPATGVSLAPTIAQENYDITVIHQSSNYNSVAIPNLAPNKSYAIIAQYEPESVAAYTCVVGTPIINYSLVEMNNPKLSAKAGNPNCFIATAAYGTPLDKRIDRLRWFRDTHLLTSAIGKSLVTAYYKYSPAIAALITQSPTLRFITRALLWVPVTLIALWQDYSGFLTLLVAISMIALCVVALKRMSRTIARRT